MKNVEIYTGPLCVFCDRAKALLNKKRVSFKEINLASDPNKMDEMIKKTNGMRTVPQIFVDGQHIGGNDKLQALENEGKLNSLLGI
ncbi:MAG TPA: glutaredoxin 3 [Pelagibacteraceae bacterium]|jgi:glutaredoxin 3|nr:glutaredoxin 3 [Pelagibacteraceae bacterium]